MNKRLLNLYNQYKKVKGYDDGGSVQPDLDPNNINPNLELTNQQPVQTQSTPDAIDRYASPDSFSNVYHALGDIDQKVDDNTGNIIRQKALQMLSGQPQSGHVNGSDIAQAFLDKSDPENQVRLRELGLNQNPVSKPLGLAVDNATDWKTLLPFVGGSIAQIKFPGLSKIAEDGKLSRPDAMIKDFPIGNNAATKTVMRLNGNLSPSGPDSFGAKLLNQETVGDPSVDGWVTTFPGSNDFKGFVKTDNPYSPYLQETNNILHLGANANLEKKAAQLGRELTPDEAKDFLKNRYGGQIPEVIPHEGFHYLMRNVSSKYGPDAYVNTMDHLMSQIPPDQLNQLNQFTGLRGYQKLAEKALKPNTNPVVRSIYNEEVLNTLRALQVNPKARNLFGELMGLTPDEVNSSLKQFKPTWKNIVNKANNLTDADILSKVPTEEPSELKTAASVTEPKKYSEGGQVNKSLLDKYNEYKKMCMGGTTIAHYDDGGKVQPNPSPTTAVIDPDKAKSVEQSFKGALGFANGGRIGEDSDNPVLNAVKAMVSNLNPMPKPSPTPTPEQQRQQEYERIRHQNLVNMNEAEGQHNDVPEDTFDHYSNGGQVQPQSDMKDLAHLYSEYRKVKHYVNGGTVTPNTDQISADNSSPSVWDQLKSKLSQITGNSPSESDQDIDNFNNFEPDPSSPTIAPDLSNSGQMSTGYAHPEDYDIARNIKHSISSPGQGQPSQEAVDNFKRLMGMVTGSIGGGEGLEEGVGKLADRVASQGDVEALEDLSKYDPKMYADEIQRGTQEDLEKAFNQSPQQQVINNGLGINNDAPKSASEAASVLKDSPLIENTKQPLTQEEVEAAFKQSPIQNIIDQNSGIVADGTKSAAESAETLSQDYPKEVLNNKSSQSRQADLENVFGPTAIRDMINDATGVNPNTANSAKDSAEVLQNVPEKPDKLVVDNRYTNWTSDIPEKVIPGKDLVPSTPRNLAKLVEDDPEELKDVTNSMPQDEAEKIKQLESGKNEDINSSGLNKASTIGDLASAANGTKPPIPPNGPQLENSPLMPGAKVPANVAGAAALPGKKGKGKGGKKAQAQQQEQMPQPSTENVFAQPTQQPQTSPLMDQFLNAQKQAGFNAANQQIQQGAALMGAGMAKANPNQVMGVIQNQAKYANLPLEQFQQKLAMQQYDPNSLQSQVARDYFKNTLHLNIPENASLGDLNQIAPYVTKSLDFQRQMALKMIEMQNQNHQNDLNRQNRIDAANIAGNARKSYGDMFLNRTDEQIVHGMINQENNDKVIGPSRQNMATLDKAIGRIEDTSVPLAPTVLHEVEQDLANAQSIRGMGASNMKVNNATLNTIGRALNEAKIQYLTPDGQLKGSAKNIDLRQSNPGLVNVIYNTLKGLRNDYATNIHQERSAIAGQYKTAFPDRPIIQQGVQQFLSETPQGEEITPRDQQALQHYKNMPDGPQKQALGQILMNKGLLNGQQ